MGFSTRRGEHSISSGKPHAPKQFLESRVGPDVLRPLAAHGIRHLRVTDLEAALEPVERPLGVTRVSERIRNLGRRDERDLRSRPVPKLSLA